MSPSPCFRASDYLGAPNTSVPAAYCLKTHKQVIGKAEGSRDPDANILTMNRKKKRSLRMYMQGTVAGDSKKILSCLQREAHPRMQQGGVTSGVLPLTFKVQGTGLGPHICLTAPSTDLLRVSNPVYHLATYRDGYRHVSYDLQANDFLVLSKGNVADPGKGKECQQSRPPGFRVSGLSLSWLWELSAWKSGTLELRIGNPFHDHRWVSRVQAGAQ